MIIQTDIPHTNYQLSSTDNNIPNSIPVVYQKVYRLGYGYINPDDKYVYKMINRNRYPKLKMKSIIHYCNERNKYINYHYNNKVNKYDN
jgi:hypothetical protein